MMQRSYADATCYGCHAVRSCVREYAGRQRRERSGDKLHGSEAVAVSRPRKAS